MLDVADLLRQSRERHAVSVAVSRVFLGDGRWRRGDPDEALVCMKAARALRTQADQADPEHASPAWDLDSHEEIAAFYSGYISEQTAAAAQKTTDRAAAVKDAKAGHGR